VLDVWNVVLGPKKELVLCGSFREELVAHYLPVSFPESEKEIDEMIRCAQGPISKKLLWSSLIKKNCP